MRIALGLEYDGSHYLGWQRQRYGTTVQASLEEALSRIAKQAIETTCAGRTDRGVHACGQVIHFDTPIERPHRAWVLGTNSKLPADIAVAWCREVPEDFHARFSATARSYRYLILNRRARSGVWARKLSFVHEPLDVAAMQQSTRVLIGEHDFSSFRAAGCQARHGVREVQELQIEARGEMIAVTIKANAFVQHMVRNIVGSLIEVGKGRREPSWIEELLRARDRRLAGPTAPPHGLYLETVDYPERFALPRPSAHLLAW